MNGVLDWLTADSTARRARSMDWHLRNLNLVRHRPCGKFVIQRPDDPEIQRLLRMDLAAFNAAICGCEAGAFVMSE
jgi:hypothetical protein